MTLNAQWNVRQNATEIREYIGDLYKWEEDVAARGMKTTKKETLLAPIRGTVDTFETPLHSEPQMTVETKPSKPKVDPSLLRKDKVPLVDYYKAWDKVDIEDELNEVDSGTTSLSAQNQANVVQAAFQDNKGKDKTKNVGLQVLGGTRRGQATLEQLKTEGNELFRQREYKLAIAKYTECMSQLEADESVFRANIELYISLLTNRAQCWLNCQDLPNGLRDCDKAISIKYDNPKAYFRKALILKKMEDWRAAAIVLAEGFKYAPGDESFIREKETVANKIREIKNKVLRDMVIKEIPEEQTFAKFNVVDYQGAESPVPLNDVCNLQEMDSQKQPRSSISSQSTAPDQDVGKKSVNAKGQPLPSDQGMSEFIGLKDIDGDKAKSTTQSKVVIQKSNTGSEKDEERDILVRFKLPDKDDDTIPRSAVVGARRATHPKSKALKSCLKKVSSIVKLAPSSKARTLKATDLDASSVDQGTPQATPVLKLQKAASKIGSASIFSETWRSMKSDQAGRESLLIDISPEKFSQLFAKGIEYDLFMETFAVIA